MVFYEDRQFAFSRVVLAVVPELYYIDWIAEIFTAVRVNRLRFQLLTAEPWQDDIHPSGAILLAQIFSYFYLFLWKEKCGRNDLFLILRFGQT